MKILLTSKDCNIGGTETFVLALATALQRAGHVCDVFFFARGALATQWPPEVPAHFGGLAECLRLVAQRRFDIVHATCAEWGLGIAAVRQLGARLVVTNHFYKTSGWTSRHCDAYTSVSHWIAETQQPGTDLPLQVVYNGIDLARFQPGPEQAGATSAGPIVAWVGRGTAVEQKRLHHVAALAPLLQRAGLRLWLAEPEGPAAVRRVLPEAADVLQTTAEVWRAVPPGEMPDFYRTVAASGGCLLTTSSYEAFGLALAEAQACGCPVIGPDLGAINEVVRPAHGGLLYAPDLPPVALAELLVTTLGDAAGMRARRAACVPFVRARFSHARMAEEYLRLYQQAPWPRLHTRAARRARWQLAPLTNWPEYLNWRWPVGLQQYETAQAFAAQGAWPLAAAAARAAWQMCPSLFFRPRRLALLLKAQAYGLRRPVRRGLAPLPSAQEESAS